MTNDRTVAKAGGTAPFLLTRLLLLLALLAIAPAANAEQTFNLRSVSFSVPDDLAVTSRTREQEYDFANAAGTIQLWARWWFPDEPLLGYPDIVRHEARTVAGRDALFIHVSAGGQRSFTLAFTGKDGQGEQFLLQLHADEASVSESEQMALFDRLVASLVYDGVPAASGNTRQKGDAAPQGGATRAFDGFRMAIPADWSEHAGETPVDGVKQVVLAPPSADSIVWVATSSGRDGMDALQTIDAFAGLLFGEYLVIKSIDGETYPEIAGSPVNAMDYTANVFPVAGIELPYKRGRGRVYRGGDAGQAFVIVTIAAADAPAAGMDELDAMARSLSFATAGAVAADQPGGTTTIEIPLAVDGMADRPGANWLPLLQQRFGTDCALVDLANWTDPRREVLEDAGATLVFVALCQGGAQPVFGVNFRYDIRTATSDYFNPLILAMFKANARQGFAFLETRDAVLATISLKDNRTLSLSIDEVTPPAAPADDPKANGNEGLTIERQGRQQDNAAPTPGGKDTEDTAQADWEAVLRPRNFGVLFDGKSLDAFRGFGFQGGDFATQARLAGNALDIAIPEKSGWAKTGIVSAAPVVRMPYPGSPLATEIAVAATLDAPDTHLMIALAPDGKVAEDPWNGFEVHVAIRRHQDGAGRYAVHYRGERRGADGVFFWPSGTQRLSFLLTPDQELELRDEAGNELFTVPLTNSFAARKWHLAVYTQGAGKNAPARLGLRQVAVNAVDWQSPPAYSAPKREAGTMELFDGKGLGRIWHGFNRHEGQFDRFASFSGGALRIMTTANDKAGTIGLYSTDAALWLDRFRDDARLRLDIGLAGEATTGFELGLQQAYGLNGNVPGNGSFFAAIRRDKEGQLHLQAGVKPAAPAIDVPVEAMPDHLAIVLHPQGIRLDMPGAPQDLVPWDGLQDGAGLRVYLLAQADPQTGAAGLVLRSVSADWSPPALPAYDGPDPQAGALPRTEVFSGAMTDGWKPMETAYAKFSELASQEDGALVLRRRDAPNNDHRIGIVSTEPVIVTDRRVLRTSQHVRLSLVPMEKFAAWISLSPRQDDPNRDGAIRVVLEEVQDGPHAGQLRFALGFGYYYFWNRYLEPGWHRTVWNGDLTIRIGNGWVSADLGHDVKIAARYQSMGPGENLYLSVRPGTERYRETGALALTSISAGWDAPPGMTESQRWTLMDDKAFDPKAYLRALASEIDGVAR